MGKVRKLSTSIYPLISVKTAKMFSTLEKYENVLTIFDNLV